MICKNIINSVHYFLKKNIHGNQNVDVSCWKGKIQVIEMKWSHSQSTFLMLSFCRDIHRHVEGGYSSALPKNYGINVHAISTVPDKEVQVWRLTSIVKEIINNENNLRKVTLCCSHDEKSCRFFNNFPEKAFYCISGQEPTVLYWWPSS